MTLILKKKGQEKVIYIIDFVQWWTPPARNRFSLEFVLCF